MDLLKLTLYKGNVKLRLWKGEWKKNVEMDRKGDVRESTECLIGVHVVVVAKARDWTKYLDHLRHGHTAPNSLIKQHRRYVRQRVSRQ